MGRFVRGDIVVLSFPFSDLSTTKRRPALVIKELDGDDVILCQITGNAKRSDKYAIQISCDEYEYGSLSRISFVRPEKIFTADSNFILYRACKLSEKKTNHVILSCIKIIGS